MTQKRMCFLVLLRKQIPIICAILLMYLAVTYADNPQMRTQAVSPIPRILIAYSSPQGHTKKMAEAIANGAHSAGVVEITIEDVNKVNISDISRVDAIIVGGPVYNANIAPEIQLFINKWPLKNGSMRDKIGAAFVSAGGMSSGEELAQLSILHSMLIFGMIVIGGDSWRSAFGASAIISESTSPPPISSDAINEYYLKKAEALGRRVAKLAIQRARCF